MGAEKEPLKRGVAWLKANQRESGRWYTRSLNADRAHYTTNAGTAFALMALKACGASDE
jgi:squalene-hopene/tetraprenyl-beta-curcumene cyclase